MINCERARELFSDCLDGSADQVLSYELHKHIETCPACNREFERFKHTWCLLDSIQDVPVPSSFRHDVLMHMARLQHESRQNTFSPSIGLNGFFQRLVPIRGLAVAVAAAVLAVMLLSLTDVIRNVTPDVEQAGTGSGIIDRQPEVFAQTPDSPRVNAWKARTLGRNTVWVDVAYNSSEDGGMLYRVILSINQDAMLRGEVANRIGAKLYLLPPGTYDPEVLRSSQPVWEGSILKDAPVVVPVVMNPYQSGSGSINLLVTWSRYGREFAHLVILPASSGLSAGGNLDFPTGRASFAAEDNGIYSLLQKVAVEYWVPVVANAYLEVKPSPVHFRGGDMIQTLQKILEPVDLDWLYAQDMVYVDYQYNLP